MNQKTSLIIQGLNAFVVIGVLVSATVLGVQGTLQGESLVAIYGAAIGFAGGAASALGSLGAAVNGKTPLSNAAMADRETTLRSAMVAAAAAPPRDVPLAPPAYQSEDE